MAPYIQVAPFLFMKSRVLISVKVKPISNIGGHSINLYEIHGGKSIMSTRNNDQTKMEEGEYFAIETFGSTGRGWVVDNVRVCLPPFRTTSTSHSDVSKKQGECSHFARKVNAPNVPLR